jgi:hypothetical protein
METPNKFVFINCPFNNGYRPFFEAIAFTISACGYIPRCALEYQDTGYARLTKIIHLIDTCDFSLHDISHTELDEKFRLPRFNMPFELGLAFGRKHSRRKPPKLLVMDRELHRYEVFLSDLKGCDLASHDGDPREAVTQVRNWLSSHHGPGLNGPKHMQGWFTRFQTDLPAICDESGWDRDRITFNDLVPAMIRWLNNYVPSA